MKSYPLLIGIRDADFMNLKNEKYDKTNMFLTDFHDMEMTLVSEDEVFSALIFEYTALKKAIHADIRNNIVVSIETIGYLKWLNEIENLEYKFECGFQDLISFADLNIDFQQYFSRVISKSPSAKLTDFSILVNKIEALKEKHPEPFQLCNGHDFMKALSSYVREKGDGRNVGDENICSSFRMIFTVKHFQKTKLYTETKFWADTANCILYRE